MYLLSDIATRFKILREAHGVSMGTLALILEFKNSSSISFIENRKSSLSFESCQKICEVFAIDTDWLLGYNDIPYSNSKLVCLEKEWLSSQYRNLFPSWYLSPQYRPQCFSFQERANIIFLLNYLKTIQSTHPELIIPPAKVDDLNSFYDLIHYRILSFRFKDATKELEHVCKCLNFIIGNKDRIKVESTIINDCLTDVYSPTNQYIRPLFTVLDARQDITGEKNFKDQWCKNNVL